ncbi:hypothetical protein FQA39_LY13226 [Lamprigera yunnana]|nr:hypothetical protein FQA39_LY13226 [Lamprigera yunnana]
MHQPSGNVAHITGFEVTTFNPKFIKRYMAIMTPLRPRMGRTVTLCLAMCTWLLGVAISSPSLFYYTTYIEQYSEEQQRIICYAAWPDGDTNESLQEYILIGGLNLRLINSCFQQIFFYNTGTKDWVCGLPAVFTPSADDTKGVFKLKSGTNESIKNSKGKCRVLIKTKCYDLKSAVERLYEELGTLEFDADHEAIYGMERYYTVQQCEELRDKYKIGRKVCRKFLQRKTCSQCLVKRISEIGLRHFLDTVNKYIKDCSDSSSSSDEEVFKAVEQNGKETTEEEEE